MATIARLAVILSTKTAGFTSGLKRAGNSLRKFAAPLAGVIKRVAQFTAVIAVGAVAALAALTKAAFTSIDALAKTADVIGISTEALAGFQLQAELTGVATGKIEKSLEKMVKNIGQASTGFGEAARTFQNLGIEAAALAQMKTEDQFILIAEEISQLSTHAERAAAAYEIFGRAGIALLPILSQGAEGIRKAREEAIKFGTAVSRVDAAKIEAANDAITRLKFLLKGIGAILADTLAPVVENIAKDFVSFATSGEGIKANLLTAIRAVAEEMGALADVMLEIRKISISTRFGTSKIAIGVAEVAALLAPFEKKKGLLLFAQAQRDITDQLEAQGHAIFAMKKPSEVLAEAWAKIEEKSRKTAESNARQSRALSENRKLATAQAEAAKLYEDRHKRAAKIIESQLTNTQKLKRAMIELIDLAARQLLTQQQFAKAVGAVRAEFAETIQEQATVAKIAATAFQAGAPGALQRGTAGASSAIAAFERGQGKTEMILREIRDVNRDQRATLQDLLRVTEQEPDEVVTLGTTG